MLGLVRRKSENLFENETSAQYIKKLYITFPIYNISKLGSHFLKFTSIQELYLQSNISYKYLPPKEIGRLKTLQQLHILNFNYQQFPEWILGLENLSELMIRGNNIQYLPEEIAKLTNLKKLRIENCELTKVPLSITKLNKLKHLSFADDKQLSHIDIECIP